MHQYHIDLRIKDIVFSSRFAKQKESDVTDAARRYMERTNQIVGN